MQKDLTKILNKLFWEKRFNGQLLGAIVGAFLGLLLLSSASQLYFDLQSLFFGKNSKDEQFIQLNKKVNIFNTIGGVSGFSEKEIEELKNINTVKSIGQFSSNKFKAGAYSDMLGFYTELFFEAIPDDFLDVDEPAFRWREGQKEIPVLVARDYLALYNFGFAPSQGLPQISAKSAQRMVMDVRIEGNGNRQNFKGRVVGFSDRINSILVPVEFMVWANKAYGKNQQKKPAKLILNVENPLDKGLLNLIKENGYEISTGRLIGEEYIVLSKVIISIILLLGLLILLLAAIVFISAFQLVVSKNAPSIKLLLEQGFAPKMISKIIENRFMKIFLSVMLTVFFFLFFIRYLFVEMLQEQGFQLNMNLNGWVYLMAIFSFGVLIWLNISKIRKEINRLT